MFGRAHRRQTPDGRRGSAAGGVKANRFTEERVVVILAEADQGGLSSVPAQARRRPVCRQAGRGRVPSPTRCRRQCSATGLSAAGRERGQPAVRHRRQENGRKRRDKPNESSPTFSGLRGCVVISGSADPRYTGPVARTGLLRSTENGLRTTVLAAGIRSSPRLPVGRQVAEGAAGNSHTGSYGHATALASQSRAPGVRFQISIAPAA